MLEDNFIPLKPIGFFTVDFDCAYCEPGSVKKTLEETASLIPSTSELCGEDQFADLHMLWNEEGLHFLLKSSVPFQDAFYPDISRGDSLELFIDTRDVKTSGFATKFCHHFFFLPKALDEKQAGEITRFRTDDVHELCTEKDLVLDTILKKNGYQLKIFIPSHCLYGYDPEQFDRLGFTYRINRLNNPSQHFSVVTEEFAIEQQPSLWSRVYLKHENKSLQPTSKKRR